MINNITFNLNSNGIGQVLPGSDYISGYLIYNSYAPGSFNLGIPKVIYSLGQAEALGITNSSGDETRATGSITVTASSIVGDAISINVTEPLPNSGSKIINLCTYTAKSSDTTATLLAQSIKNAINNNLITGYTASGAGSTITITARAGMGIALNAGTPISYSNSNVSSPGLITITQFSGGTASKLAFWHYQISEFFRIQPNGTLWIGFYAIPGSYTFSEIGSMQAATNGVIRQFMVYSANGTSVTNINADLDAIQAVGESMSLLDQPAQVIYGSNMISITDLTTLSNLGLRNDPYVSCIIGQDGASLGAQLCLNLGQSIPCIGACLGTVALAPVENCIANVGLYNLVTGSELAVPAFANKVLVSSLPNSELVALDSYQYIFIINKSGQAGTYFNDSYTAVSLTNNFCYIERERVIQKAQRIIYTSYLPLENSDLYLNPDGTLTSTTIRIFKDALSPSLNQMVANGEISAFNILIDPRQNVQATSSINVTVQIIGVGIARNIVVNLGYVMSL